MMIGWRTSYGWLEFWRRPPTRRVPSASTKGKRFFSLLLPGRGAFLTRQSISFWKQSLCAARASCKQELSISFGVSGPSSRATPRLRAKALCRRRLIQHKTRRIWDKFEYRLRRYVSVSWPPLGHAVALACKQVTDVRCSRSSSSTTERTD